MHTRFCERIETALASLQRRIERAQKPIDRGAAERQIGRLLGRATALLALLIRSFSRHSKPERLKGRVGRSSRIGQAVENPARTGFRRGGDGCNSRAAARYAIRLVDDQILPAGLRLEWSRRAEWDDWSRHSEGCYVLRTNLRDWSSEALWRALLAGRPEHKHALTDRIEGQKNRRDREPSRDAQACDP